MEKIKGFLHAQGTSIVNGKNEKILLRGWGLGNWLLQEGYMWMAGGICRFDRPRRIEQVIAELTGKAYAEKFWKKFRSNYITEQDIQYMAQLGYNSVRIPINWRVLMEDDEGITWKEDGFELLDACLDWCEKAGIYAFLDLHGAPGGQTGANIDDSVDDVPRLFTDPDKRKKCITLWCRLAMRYKDREVVGGYDLLNEPICPPDDNHDHDWMIPELTGFYRELIEKIREIDGHHLLSVEGAHWATDLSVFEEPFDDNMVLHFHRYAELPQKKCLDAYIQKAEKLHVPLWLGETGENVKEWFAALYPLCVSLDIGYNLWPWKKMECTNSICSIRKPKGYEKILAYASGGPHPGYEEARAILDEYLNNILLENCVLHQEIMHHEVRRPPFSMLAVDFDELPGRGQSFSGKSTENPALEYRRGCGMYLKELYKKKENRFAFDCQWDRFALVLKKGEFASYSAEGCGPLTVRLFLETEEKTIIRATVSEQKNVTEGETTMQKRSVMTAKEGKEQVILPGTEQVEFNLDTEPRCQTAITIAVPEGCVTLKRLEFSGR